MEYTAKADTGNLPETATALVPPALVENLRQLIAEARQTVAATVNAGSTLLYWRIAKRVVEEVLGKERAAYGRQIAVSLLRQLEEEHGSDLPPFSGLFITGDSPVAEMA